MSVTSSVSKDGRQVTIQVAGRFDFAAHQAFMRAYSEHPRGHCSFVVDLQQADYMDSSAMGMLLQLRDYGAKDSEMELRNARDAVLDILRIANFDKIFRMR